MASFYLFAAAEYGGVPDRLVADYAGHSSRALLDGVRRRLTAFDIARAITDELATVADVLSHELSWQEYIDAAMGKDSHHIRQLLVERLFDVVDAS